MARIRMHVVNARTAIESVVVTAAPYTTRVPVVMVDMWRDGLTPHLEYIPHARGDRVRFGTRGHGCGVVTYVIGRRVPKRDLAAGRMVPGDFYELTRVW